MDSKTQEVLREAMELSPMERASLADQLLSSLDKPDSIIDTIWKKEIGKRLDVYDKGLMETVSVNEILTKYKHK